MQSARMASEIHKKRIGKGFKISEEIVLKEEMYEEEDDDLPRHYRALAANLHTSSEDMNRLNAYITNQVAIRTFARHEEVNRMFSESFPNAFQQHPQRPAQPTYPQPLQGYHGNETAGQTPQMRSVGVSPAPAFQPIHGRSQSLSQTPSGFIEPSPRRSSVPTQSASPIQLPPTVEQLSTPELTPASGSPETPQSRSPPASTQPHVYQTTMAAPPSPSLPGSFDPAFFDLGLGSVDPSLQQHPFVNDLPEEPNIVPSLDPADFFSEDAWYGETPDFLGYNTSSTDLDPAQLAQSASLEDGYHSFSKSPHPPSGTGANFYSQQQQQQQQQQQHHKWQAQQLSRLVDPSAADGSRIGTPDGGVGDYWDTWLNTDQL